MHTYTYWPGKTHKREDSTKRGGTGTSTCTHKHTVSLGCMCDERFFTPMRLMFGMCVCVGTSIFFKDGKIESEGDGTTPGATGAVKTEVSGET